MKTVSMTQLRAVPLTLEIPPPHSGLGGQSRTILYQGHKLTVVEVRGELHVAHYGLYQDGCEDVPQL